MGKQPRKSSLIQTFLYFLLYFVLVGSTFTFAHHFSKEIIFQDTKKKSNQKNFDLKKLFFLEEPVNFLILGVDEKYERESYGYAVKVKNSLKGRSDVIIVCRVDPIQKKITFLHVPRDTRVFLDNKRAKKINMLNFYAGPDFVKKSLAKLLEIELSFYVLVNVEKIKELVDLVGGIEVNVPKAMHYQDQTAGLKINLESGKQTLGGEETIAFLRYRGDALGDINRIQRQQMFIEAAQKKIRDPRLIAKIPYFIGNLSHFLVSDSDYFNFLKILGFLKSNESELQKVMLMLPGSFSVPEYTEELISKTIDLSDPINSKKTLKEITQENSCYSQKLLSDKKLICRKKIKRQKAFASYWLPNLGQIRKTIKQSFTQNPRSSPRKKRQDIYINLERASKENSSLQKIKQNLIRAKFSKIELSKLTFDKSKSVIYAQKANKKEAELVRRKAGLNLRLPIKLASAGLPHSDVVIVVGEDIEDFLKKN